MVSSGHSLASLAGTKILQEGGNAVDAALAASFTLAVVRPHTSGPGGDLFSLVFMRSSGKVEALNASGPAPQKATVEFFKERGLTEVPTAGHLSIAVPGAVDGWVELHRKYGTMDLARLAADAIDYAREGFPLYRSLADRIAELAPSYPRIEHSFRKPLDNLNLGKILVQKDLAHTLEQITKNGRDSFYRGEIGARMCAALQAEGGILSEEDLQGRQAEWLNPIATTYRDYTVFEQPPVSQGFIVLEMLNIIEGYPLEKMDPADIIHVMVEAKKIAFQDRINHLEDPRFGDPKIKLLISKEHARSMGKLISDVARSQQDPSLPSGSDTTYLCTADREGNVVSLIQSIFAPFGSRIVAGETGLVMNNRLCSFGLDPGKANALRPGKRPAHTLNSYMVFRNREFLVVGGTPGADDQPQTNVQILHHLLDQHLAPQPAIEVPRWSHRPGIAPRSDAPEELRLEDGFSPEVVKGLVAKGHKVNVVDRWAFGGAAVIVRDPASGTWMAGADPRREGYAIGW
ncbi:MAG: gamma-glutamyltransferase [Candidatus Binatia bacterium]